MIVHRFSHTCRASPRAVRQVELSVGRENIRLHKNSFFVWKIYVIWWKICFLTTRKIYATHGSSHGHNLLSNFVLLNMMMHRFSHTCLKSPRPARQIEYCWGRENCSLHKKWIFLHKNACFSMRNAVFAHARTNPKKHHVHHFWRTCLCFARGACSVHGQDGRCPLRNRQERTGRSGDPDRDTECRRVRCARLPAGPMAMSLAYISRWDRAIPAGPVPMPAAFLGPGLVCYNNTSFWPQKNFVLQVILTVFFENLHRI